VEPTGNEAKADDNAKPNEPVTSDVVPSISVDGVTTDSSDVKDETKEEEEDDDDDDSYLDLR